MGIRLNKFISETGICSRHEADKYISEGRITVNGSQPTVGQQVNYGDLVLLDDVDLKLSRSKFTALEKEQGKSKKNIPNQHITVSSIKKRGITEETSREKYGKYNKYAAARKAFKNGGFKRNEKDTTKREEVEQLVVRMSKNLSRSKVAQRILAAPKSAALRKTSKNNLVNKAKRRAERQQGTDE